MHQLPKHHAPVRAPVDRVPSPSGETASIASPVSDTMDDVPMEAEVAVVGPPRKGRIGDEAGVPIEIDL